MESGTQNRVKHNLRVESGNDRWAIDILYPESDIRNRVTGTHRWEIGIRCRGLGSHHWVRNSFRLVTDTRRR